MGVTRRQLLKRGLFGGALLAAGGLGISLWPTKRVTPRRPTTAVDGFGLSMFAAIAEVMTPGADPVEVAHRADDFLAGQAPGDLVDLGRLLRLLENGVANGLFTGRPMPFSRMSIDARRTVLFSMRDSRLTLRRGGYQVLRRIVVASRWTDPAAWSTLGYGGPPQLAGPT
jgi:hypothetical protein